MKTNKLILAALMASLAVPALAVPALAEDGPTGQVETTRIVTRNGNVQQNADGTIRIAFAEGANFSFSRQGAVKNAPYSAQMLTERQQNLPDGNQIADHHTSMAYRDGAGRTRQEVVDAKGELKLVTIHDPVAGATWILRPQDRTATRIARLGEAERQAIRKAAEAGRKAGEAAHARVERHKLEDGKEEIIVKRVVRTDGAALENGLHAQRDLQSRLAPLTAGAFGDMKWAAKATTKDLGTRDFNGVKAEGKLRSYEIPAGEIGNRNPIVVSDETWYAPDLQITVYTKHSDPRSGDTVFRLDNLKREEPAAGLFAVPSDYTVRDPLAKLAEKAGKAQ
jgi:hypothetical protein